MQESPPKKRSNEVVFSRSSCNNINENMLKTLYEDVLLFCESPAFNTLKSLNITSKEFKGYLGNIWPFDYLSNSSKKTETKSSFETKIKRWYINRDIKVVDIHEKIIFVSTENKLMGLLKHIRNAFAHNLIVVEGQNVLLSDFVTTKKGNINWAKPTMLGNISVDNLNIIINAIKQTTKNHGK